MFSRRVLGSKGKEGMLPVVDKVISTLRGVEGLFYTLPALEICQRHFEEHVVHGRLEWTELPVDEHSSSYDIPPNVLGAERWTKGRRLLSPPWLETKPGTTRSGSEDSETEESDNTPNPGGVDPTQG